MSHGRHEMWNVSILVLCTCGVVQGYTQQHQEHCRPSLSKKIWSQCHPPYPVQRPKVRRNSGALLPELHSLIFTNTVSVAHPSVAMGNWSTASTAMPRELFLLISRLSCSS